MSYLLFFSLLDYEEDDEYLDWLDEKINSWFDNLKSIL